MKSSTRRIARGSKWPLWPSSRSWPALWCSLPVEAATTVRPVLKKPAPLRAKKRARKARRSSGAGEEEAKGEPLVTWTYTDVNTEGPQYKNIEETARVYQEWINSHGGIGGRPLEANFCDARGTPTGAAACAREAAAGRRLR